MDERDVNKTKQRIVNSVKKKNWIIVNAYIMHTSSHVHLVMKWQNLNQNVSPCTKKKVLYKKKSIYVNEILCVTRVLKEIQFDQKKKIQFN